MANVEPLKLKYLFHALFKDGTVLSQTPEDISAQDPIRSAFFDVANRMEEVVRFALEGEGHVWVVDLMDGHFELDDVMFFMGDPDDPPPEGTLFRLIYVRRHWHQMKSGPGGREETHRMGFIMGWQYTDPGGRNRKQTLLIL